MSFVTAVPEFVTAAAGDLAGIGSTLAEANAAAALPTTGVVAAAADEISTGIAAMFGTYAQQYQALSAQAASFQNEFVSLLNGGAAAYMSTEVANAEQTLLGAISGPMSTGTSFAANAAADTPPLLGGLVPSIPLASPIPGVPLPDLPVPSLPLPSLPLPSLPALPPLPIPPVPGLPSAPDLTPLLNGLSGAANQVGSALSGIGAFLQNLLFPAPPPGVSPYPNPYQVLGETTVINLNDFGSHYRPFPILNQIAVNQGHYAQIFGSGVATDLQGFPANVPANIQLALQGASTFNPAAMGQLFLAGSTGYAYTVGSSLSGLGAALQSTFNGPVVQGDLANMNQAIASANYHAAVQDGAHAVIDSFITGFDTSHLAITPNIDLSGFPAVSVAVTIAGPIGVLGPASALLPVLTATGQQAQGFASLIPPTSIPGRMAHDFANGISAMTDGGISANFAETISTPNILTTPLTPALAGTAMFGLPLQLGFAVLGPPFATADGLATGATAFSTALLAGNPLGALNALGDMPAYILNGFLNGQVFVDLPLPVAVTLVPGTPPVTITAVAHVPLDGILVPPQPVTATVQSLTVPILGTNVTIPPITTTLGGTEFSGILPFLVNTMPQQVALAMSYQNSGP
jgi:PE family